MRSITGDKPAKGDPLLTVAYFLKARYLERCNKLASSQTHYLQAIKFVDSHKNMKGTNIQSACYHGLSRISHLLNDIHKALAYSQKGLESLF